MALKQLAYVSRREAESKTARPDWAVISISDPFHYPATLHRGWHSVLRLVFSDIERESQFNELFSPCDARKIIDFVKEADDAGCDGILVHCKAGISRSAAIAKWIASAYNLPCDYAFEGHNGHVYATLCEVAKDR